MWNHNALAQADLPRLHRLHSKIRPCILCVRRTLAGCGDEVVVMRTQQSLRRGTELQGSEPASLVQALCLCLPAVRSLFFTCNCVFRGAVVTSWKPTLLSVHGESL